MSRKQRSATPVTPGIPVMSDEQRAQWGAQMAENARKRLTRDLGAFTSQGLYIVDDNSSLTRERAIMRVAAAQLRAIKLAIMCGEENVADPNSWEPGDGGFTEIDCGIALAGVISLLRHAPDIIDHVVGHSEESDAESEAS